MAAANPLPIEFTHPPAGRIECLATGIDLTTGYSLAIVFKLKSSAEWHEFVQVWDTSTGNVLVLEASPSNTLNGVQGGSGVTPSSTITLTDDVWYLAILTKASGSATPRFHVYDFDSPGWIHRDASAALGDPIAVGGGDWIGIGEWPGSDGLNGYFAGAAIWGDPLSDGACEALTSGFGSWLRSSPQWMVVASGATPMVDENGPGNEYSRTGSGDIDPAPNQISPLQWTHYEQVVLADEPAAYYRMNEASGQPQDSSGNARHITGVSGTPAYAQVGAIATDPTSKGIRLELGENFYLATAVTTVTDNWTIETWAKLGGGSSENGRTVIRNATTDGWELGCNINGTFYYENIGAGAGSNSIGALNTSEWKLIHVISRAGVIEYWINGVADTIGAGGGAPGTPSGTVQIGAAVGLDILLDEVAIYPTALPPARVYAHYNAAFDTVPFFQILSSRRTKRF